MARVRREKGNNTTRPKIAVLGLGHVGLPTALGLADLGWDVIGADGAADKVEMLKAGRTTFFEPGLAPLLAKHLKSGRFQATAEVDEAVRSAAVLFVCVGTPQGEDGAADLSQIEAVARMIAANLNGYKLIVEKSTVPAATAERIKRTILRYSRLRVSSNGKNGKGPAAHSEASFDVASNPEFLQEGKAIHNFFKPDRVVIGVESEKARAILEEIYRPLNCPVLVTNLTTAELIKHAANAFLSTKISFINMIADICEAVGADVQSVARGIGMDPRIGFGFLQAGIGFGGYCFPKDLRALIHLAEEHAVDASLLQGVEQVNLRRPGLLLDKVRKALWVVKGKTIAVLGLAFKPDTDDIREAPAMKIIQELLDEGATVRLYDPQAMENARAVFPEEPERITYCRSAYDAAHGAQALLVLTEWEEFRNLDLNRLRDVMQVPVVVDGRNLYGAAAMAEAGFEYHSIGRPSAEHFLSPIEPKEPRKARVPEKVQA